MYVLGISCHYHDSSAALLLNGRLVAASDEERFSRIKYDHSFPTRAVDWCMATEGIDVNDISYVVFYEKPFRKYERSIKTMLSTFPASSQAFSRMIYNLFREKLWLEAELRETLGYEGDLLYADHHLSHAASSFFCSPFEEAAIGLLYSAFTAFLGFQVNEGEYKVMGMAPYGEPKYVDKIYKIFKLNSDGSFWFDMDYFKFHRSIKNSYTSKFEKLFGRARKPGALWMIRKNGSSMPILPPVFRKLPKRSSLKLRLTRRKLLAVLKSASLGVLR